MANAERIAARLLEKDPDPRLALRYSDSLQRLVAVVLSARCTDARVMAHLPHRLAFRRQKHFGRNVG